MKRKYLAFDIETAKALPGGGRDWRDSRPIGISCAAALLSDSDEPLLWYGVTGRKRPAARVTRSEARRMVNYLARQVQRGYTIVSWNGVGFDFDILAEESGMLKECQRLAGEHIDMMFYAVCVLGYGIGLDAAARGMKLQGKAEGICGALAPVLWAGGGWREVLRGGRGPVLSDQQGLGGSQEPGQGGQLLLLSHAVCRHCAHPVS